MSALARKPGIHFLQTEVMDSGLAVGVALPE